ncbi:flippase-like domain-containing protein [candidate division KSB1 bacterium]|nr:flippase-like domain-containing protein [candidate division KSB1 bacterium]
MNREISTTRKRGKTFYLRAIISLVLLAIVFSQVGLADLWHTLMRAQWVYLLLSFLMTPVLVMVSSWKWQVILRAYQIRVPLTKLFWLYIVGYFFNTVLPTNVGGDVVRAFALGKSTGKPAQAFSSVFAERFTGLTALLFMALVAFVLALRQFWDLRLFFALILSVIGYFILLILVLKPAILQTLKSRISFKPVSKVFLKLEKFQAALLELQKRPGTLWFAMANSFLFYLVAVLNVYVSALAFRADITFLHALVITPIVLIITMIPISIGGIGLAEGAYVFTFERLGMLGATGLLVALLMRLKALVAGVIGGLAYSGLGLDVRSELRQSQEKQKDIKGTVNYYSGFEDVMRRKQTPLHKYREIVCGPVSWFTFIKFDLLTSLFAFWPGMVGYILRQLFYPFLFKHTGKGVAFGKSVTLRHAHKIEIGSRCVIDEYCSLSAQGDENSAIALGNQVLLGRSTVLSTRNGQIEIGDFSNIGANCRLGTTSRLVLGKYVLLAANCYVGGAQHKFDRCDIPIMRQGYDSKGGVVIEDDVWLGAGVTILDGVKIGTGCVIGAGSIVTKDLPPYSIARGIPAKVVADRRELNQ